MTRPATATTPASMAPATSRPEAAPPVCAGEDAETGVLSAGATSEVAVTKTEEVLGLIDEVEFQRPGDGTMKPPVEATTL